MNVGLRIKELRELKNMSQEDLADKIGVSKQMISHYENGINVPRGKKITLLAKVFKITEEEFYTSKSTPNLTDALSYSYLLAENDRLHKKLEEILERENTTLQGSNTDKDEIISLLRQVNELKDKLRDQA
jgi:transcriptional regulator with XRE-family HTH domain